ncbi:hypothetical protein [Mycobacterium paraintracellulare]|uniref:hypothetical protein n=1 Tax=Mycobacterium paraintracellulare TaxID=1138383 RepID=UPI0019164F12|nr:hypothetical protein [Mycobacterium paraintracellulare]
MTVSEITPGRRLIAAMQQELEFVNEDTGRDLEFSPQDSAALDIAAAAADKIADLQEVYALERAGQSRPATLAKLAAEIRGQQRTQLEALAKITLDPDHLSNVRRAAARSRWGANGRRHA